ncbi:hypothetical protein CSB93_2393 [Pseudomonas paraeruginosa]|uniref:Uncharacterized protein n=1 Tax=Pseudomonas paraeruginosa TaxID=2994495 RepID=A0A2R3IY42_9PSED|nr:hypothetical protein CSB93_2393 [Pseudomonas paraeruginosa]AWE94975.1 hypothetical protein CSC28_1160 [Pseudomonas paraeruginosa]
MGRIHGFLVLPWVSERTLAGSLRHRPRRCHPRQSPTVVFL